MVDYYTPIAKYWPEFGAHGKDKGTVYDALTHRLGVPIMPRGVTAELMCDWNWMVSRIADMTPLFEPGTKSAYMAYTFGWVIGEVVRRTDPKRRPFGTFVQEEICQPLGIDNLWVGIPDEAEPRVAKVTNWPSSGAAASARHPGVLRDLAHPPHLDTTEEIFGRSDVRRACIPGIGGIMNARSQARLWALLAQGGELDGVRLLSEERIRPFTVPCPPVHYDYVEGEPPNYTIAGFRRATPFTGNNPHIVGHTGAGGSIGWADLDAHLAVAFTHNRMFRAPTLQDHPYMPIVNAIRKTLGLSA